MKMFNRTILTAAALAATVAAAGCTLESPDPPSPTGPSTFGLSLTVTASPDILTEDGKSQSAIRIVARDANGQPLPNVALRVDTVVGSAVVDQGTLSARTVTTNASGEATVIFTAPRAPFIGVDTGTVVTIAVSPLGTDFGTRFSSDVRIRLVPESVALTPGAPIPNFFFSPLNPVVGQNVIFDASASTDEDGFIVSYRWNYGDGDIETSPGPTEQHDFTAPGTYPVTLTVTDNEGKTASITRTVTIQ